MGYTVLSNVVMNSHLHAQARKISGLVPFELTVTSGIRDAAAQARAMFTKIEEGADLVADYADDDFARGVEAAYPDVQAATDFIQSYADQGRGSRHYTARSLDFRTTGGADNRLSEPQIDQLMEAARTLGWTSHREYSPPHLHVSFPAGEKKSLWYLAAGGLAWMFLRS